MTRDRFNRLAGFAPVFMSALAALLVFYVLATGWERGLKDEGAAAHVWQLLVAAQAPLILAYLATARWERPMAVAKVVGLQVAGLGIALLGVALAGL
jgi:hypothetical protein